MSGRLQRLVDMPARELSFRARGLLRVQTERLRVSIAPPVWTRRALDRVLHARVLDAPLRAALAGARWSEAGSLLRTGMLRRANRFVIDPREAPQMSRAIGERWPEAAADAARTADAILAGQHQILGYRGLSFAPDGAAIDWHLDPVHQRRAPMRFWADVQFLDPTYGDHKIIWEINRQQYFLALGRAYWLTGDRRYAARIVRDIHDWLDANPPLVGINWASMLELGFRSLSWVSAIHFLLADGVASGGAPDARAPVDDAWLLDVFVGLDGQLAHIEGHLSRYFSPNTHLTGEALALYVAGVALPELASSDRWASTGKSILLDEIATQINGDGGHAELSTCYHRYTLDFYSLAAITAELEGDTLSAGRFRDAVERLRHYMTAFVGADGVVPAIGDDDGGKLWGLSDRDPRDVRDSLALASLLADPPEGAADVPSDAPEVPEEALWLGWSVRPSVRRLRPGATPRARQSENAVTVRHLRDSGYVVVHTGHGDHLAFDVGPHGFRNGGHAHADALSITLSVEDTPFLIDPGTATYTMDPALRNRMRDTAAHNTVTIDARPSAIPRGAFQWETRATARITALTSNPRFMIAEGTHDGFTPAAHRRSIVHSDDTGWLIADIVDGDCRTIDQHWHFDPQWHVEAAESHALLATGPTGGRVWLLHEGGVSSLVRGDDARGWCSPRYGALVPTFTARVRHESSHVPLATWIGAADDTVAPSIASIPVPAGCHAGAYRVTHRTGATITVLHPITSWTPGVTTIAGVTSDSRFLQLTARRDGRLTMALADVGRATAPALHMLDLTCSERVEDLYLSLHEEVAELWATTPPQRLQLRFADGWRPRRVRLNGRDTVGLLRGESLDIPASFWSAAESDAKCVAASPDLRSLPRASTGWRADAARTVASERHS